MLLVCIFIAIAAAAALIFFLRTGMIWQSLVVAAAVYLGIHVLLIGFYAIVGLFVDTSKPIVRQSDVCRAGAWAISTLGCFYAGARVHLRGEERLPQSGRFVMVSNHRSGVDPIAAMSAMRKYNVSFISKPSNMQLPVLGRVAYGAGCLPIDRENDRNALRTILQAADYLRQGFCSMAIYPEGTRNRGEGLLPFHAGSFKLPQRAGVPLVIMATTGTSRRDRRGLLGRNVELTVLETLDAEKVSSMSTAELSAYAMDKIGSFLAQKESA